MKIKTALLILLTIFATACDKVPDDVYENPSQKKQVREIATYYATGASVTYLFHYDIEDRLSSISLENGDRYEIEYHAGQLRAIYYHDNSTNTSFKNIELYYINDQLDMIRYAYDTPKYYKVYYSSSDETYQLTYEYDEMNFVFDGENLTSFTRMDKSEVFTDEPHKTAPFFALNSSRALQIAINLTGLGIASHHFNKHLPNNLYIGSRQLNIQAEYDADGYPAKITMTDPSGYTDQQFITYQ